MDSHAIMNPESSDFAPCKVSFIDIIEHIQYPNFKLGELRT